MEHSWALLCRCRAISRHAQFTLSSMPKASSGNGGTQSSNTIDMLGEAAAPGTSLGRLSEMLGICDTPRINFARRFASGSQVTRAGRQEPAIAVHGDPLPAFAEVVAAHPALDRAEWVRALEIAPAGALRNPRLKALLGGRFPIIEKDFELLALGELARHRLGQPRDDDSERVLIQLILGGLPDPESFGARFFERRKGEAQANRYCWNGDRLDRAHMRGAALHAAGNLVIDVLCQSRLDGAREAVKCCSRIGWKLISSCDEWKLFVERFRVAPEAAREFSVEAWVVSDWDNESDDKPVIGWSDLSMHWIRHRPGFLEGQVCKSSSSAPASIRGLVRDGWTSTAAFVDDGDVDWSIACKESGAKGSPVRLVNSISRGIGGCEGVVLLKGCMFGSAFPLPEMERLVHLFGADSWAVRFASDPDAAICPACGEVSLDLVDGGACEECGGDQDLDDDEDDD